MFMNLSEWALLILSKVCLIRLLINYNNLGNSNCQKWSIDRKYYKEVNYIGQASEQVDIFITLTKNTHTKPSGRTLKHCYWEKKNQGVEAKIESRGNTQIGILTSGWWRWVQGMHSHHLGDLSGQNYSLSLQLYCYFLTNTVNPYAAGG